MNNKFKLSYCIISQLVLILLLITNHDAFCQLKDVYVDQTNVQIATVTNKKLIKYFVEDFMIPEKKVKKMVIYDLAGDGFGEHDIARTYPGARFYLLTPSNKAQKLMNRWSFGGNIKFTANFSDPPELFENAPDSVRAFGGIFAALLKGLRRNYRGKPFKLQLQQNGDVTAVEMWGYNPYLMKYKPPPVAKVPEKIPVMKLIYLEKTVVDSVYLGAK